MAYRIEFLRSAAREFEALDRTWQRRLADEIERIAQDPFAPGVTTLRGYAGLRRSRVGDYRIIFCVEEQIVTIVRIGTRGEVYRRLERLLRQIRP